MSDSNTIWNFSERFDASVCAESPPDTCIFCETTIMRDLEEEQKIHEDEISYGWSDNFTTRFVPNIGFCPACGWWRYEVRRFFGIGGRKVRDFWCGRLKSFSDTDIEMPLAEIRQYLTAKYDARFRIDLNSSKMSSVRSFEASHELERWLTAVWEIKINSPRLVIRGVRSTSAPLVPFTMNRKISVFGCESNPLLWMSHTKSV